MFYNDLTIHAWTDILDVLCLISEVITLGEAVETSWIAKRGHLLLKHSMSWNWSSLKGGRKMVLFPIKRALTLQCRSARESRVLHVSVVNA